MATNGLNGGLRNVEALLGFLNSNDAMRIDETLGGVVGRRVSANIVAARDERGPFTSLADLMDVDLVGPARVEGMLDIADAGTLDVQPDMGPAREPVVEEIVDLSGGIEDPSGPASATPLLRFNDAFDAAMFRDFNPAVPEGYYLRPDSDALIPFAAGLNPTPSDPVLLQDSKDSILDKIKIPPIVDVDEAIEEAKKKLMMPKKAPAFPTGGFDTGAILGGENPLGLLLTPGRLERLGKVIKRLMDWIQFINEVARLRELTRQRKITPNEADERLARFRKELFGETDCPLGETFGPKFGPETFKQYDFFAFGRSRMLTIADKTAKDSSDTVTDFDGPSKSGSSRENPAPYKLKFGTSTLEVRLFSELLERILGDTLKNIGQTLLKLIPGLGAAIAKLSEPVLATLADEFASVFLQKLALEGSISSEGTWAQGWVVNKRLNTFDFRDGIKKMRARAALDAAYALSKGQRVETLPDIVDLQRLADVLQGIVMKLRELVSVKGLLSLFDELIRTGKLDTAQVFPTNPLGELDTLVKGLQGVGQGLKDARLSRSVFNRAQGKSNTVNITLSRSVRFEEAAGPLFEGARDAPFGLLQPLKRPVFADGNEFYPVMPINFQIVPTPNEYWLKSLQLLYRYEIKLTYPLNWSATLQDAFASALTAALAKLPEALRNGGEKVQEEVEKALKNEAKGLSKRTVDAIRK